MLKRVVTAFISHESEELAHSLPPHKIPKLKGMYEKQIKCRSLPTLAGRYFRSWISQSLRG
jgi:hypothetical protein